MKLEDICQIINATVIHKGDTEEVFWATVYAQECEEGDLCFVSDSIEFDKALENRAGVVIYSDTVPKNSFYNVTALKVEDIATAALKLAGSVVGEEDASFELLDPKQMTFLKMILQQKSNIAFLPEDWKKAFDMIMQSKKRLFVGTDEKMLKAIRNNKKLYDKKASGQIVSADSLFRTTFKIDKYIYQYKELTFLHIDHLRRAVAFCKEYELPYSIDKVTYTKHFIPIFLEGEPSVQEVMKNDKVVILSDNLEDIVEAREYASDIGHWMAKTIVMVPPKQKVEGIKYPTYYRDDADIMEGIEKLAYNYLFIYTQDEGLRFKIRSHFGF
jgi:ferrochelatase